MGQIRECYCGLVLSNDSTLHDAKYCSSPCSGDAATSCGGFGYLTLYELISAINTTVPTSKTPSPTSPSSPTKITIPGTGHDTNKKGLWIGICLGLFFLILLVFSLLRLGKFPRLTRKRTTSSLEASRGFLGGYRLNHRLRPQRSRDTFDDGRRFGCIADGPYVAPLDIQTEEAGRKSRNTFEAWKRGSVPASPEDVKASIMMGDTLSEETRASAGMGDTKRGELRDLGLTSVKIGRLAELPGSEVHEESPMDNGLKTGELKNPKPGNGDDSTNSFPGRRT